MEKYLKHIIVLTLAVVGVVIFSLLRTPGSFSFSESKSPLPQKFSELRDGENYTFYRSREEIQLEVAKSIEARIQGLMGRESMDKNQGMIFLFDNEADRTFHMRNVYFPLDMIFIDSNFKVVKIHSNTKVNQGSELYSSESPAQYVIELNGGRAEELDIEQGMILNL